MESTLFYNYFYLPLPLHTAGLDVDRVCREVDVQALQQNISNVTFCNIESEVHVHEHVHVYTCTLLVLMSSSTYTYCMQYTHVYSQMV